LRKRSPACRDSKAQFKPGKGRGFGAGLPLHTPSFSIDRS
jgi:hypothetical protein